MIHHNLENAGQCERLDHLIRGIEVAMLVTVDEDGMPRSRPMLMPARKFDGFLWFLTKASSHAVGEVAFNRRVNVSLASPERQRYVSICGTVEVIYDRVAIEALWQPEYGAIFPLGLDDPDLALLKVAVEDAEYWTSPMDARVHVFGVIQVH